MNETDLVELKKEKMELEYKLKEKKKQVLKELKETFAKELSEDLESGNFNKDDLIKNYFDIFTERIIDIMEGK